MCARADHAVHIPATSGLSVDTPNVATATGFSQSNSYDARPAAGGKHLFLAGNLYGAESFVQLVSDYMIWRACHLSHHANWV
jgi:hypothetical protein